MSHDAVRRRTADILAKDLPPPYQENEEIAPQPQPDEQQALEQQPCEVLDLLANCRVTAGESESEIEYAEIGDMGVWHSTPIARHKSKISLTWVLKENLQKTEEKPRTYERRSDFIDRKEIDNREKRIEERLRTGERKKDRVAGRNEFYHNLRFKNAYDEFVNGHSGSDTSVGSEEREEIRKKHRHRHRRKRRSKFGYDIRDLDGFLSEATIDRPGNIPVVVAFPTTLYQTHHHQQRELTLALGTVVNAVFKNQHWLYVQTPHGDEGYIMYSACLPLGILPSKSSLQKKTPCWESSTDIYPRPCGNLTDNEKEQLRGRTRSETRHRTKDRKYKTSCAEKDFDTLYLKTKSVCSNIDKVHEKEVKKTKRQTLLVVNSDFKGSYRNRTLSVKKGDVVVLLQGSGVESDVDLEWFYVKNKDGCQGFIPAAVAGHGYI
ncbi:uncharacterized protein LOC121731836 [Aricia agestis]|uniref:uncharacterized protein LOC121731836 n=1 Tax=Aricia agestis TaxID=91739 RepID=UPI001C20A3E3|nr:uncharacterized protein LOC121731836 [Aricia agestis]